MTQEISARDLTTFRSNFPALSNKSYFNFGGLGTLPRQALDAIFASYNFMQAEGPFSARIFTWLEDEQTATKQSLAEELGVTPDTIALTHNVTEGCNIGMWGVNWQPGDHLLLSDSEHPGVVAIAELLSRRKGVKLTYCPLSDCQNDPVEAVRGHLTDKTKMVALSHVLWNTGRVLRIREIASLCRERGIWLLVDGAQSAGVLPLNLLELGVDFFAMTGHKWMCGPEGVGAFYVRQELIEKLEPTFVGWRGVEFDDPAHPTATRYEVATSAFPLLAGLRRALELHRSWGSAQQRYDAIRENALYLAKRLESIGARLVCPTARTASLVSFTVPGQTPSDVSARLENDHILIRTIPSPDCLRASVHYFTTREEIDRLVNTIASGT